MNTLKKILLAFLLFTQPFQSGAWGLLGHRIVGQIAEGYLTAKASQEIKRILGTESMAMAANWADFIKSDPSFSYLSSWHYIDCKDSLTYPLFQQFLQNDSATDAYTQLNFLIQSLRNKQLSRDKQLLYLRLLIHIVGDIHQPMHTGRVEDKGGNAVKVWWFNEPSNLHGIWDEKLIGYQLLSYTEYTAAIDHTDSIQRQKWQEQPVSEWLFESYLISRQLYAEIRQPGQRLGYRYNFDHIQTVNEQLLKAGVRLAGLLNGIFGS